MDLIALLKRVVMKMDAILSEYAYDQEQAWKNPEYQLLKKASDNLSEGVQKVERARFYNQSFVCIKDPYVSENLEDYVDWKLVDQVKDIISY